MKKLLYRTILLTAVLLTPRVTCKTVIAVPVTSMWTEPTKTNPPYQAPLFSKDVPTHNTQLLYGEQITLLENPDNGWLHVRALHQPEFSRKNNTWGYCEGWIEAKDVVTVKEVPCNNLIAKNLWVPVRHTPSSTATPIMQVSMGTHLLGARYTGDWWQISLLDGTTGFVATSDIISLERIEKYSSDQLRNFIIQQTHLFLGSPYVWGGRSAYDANMPQCITGIDCSGIFSLVFKSCGIIIPRNSHAQFVKATPIEPKDLQPGDFIFLKHEINKFECVSHILLYLGNDQIIEATGNQDAPCPTRIVSSQECFGCNLSQVIQGMRVTRKDDNGDWLVYGGSFFN